MTPLRSIRIGGLAVALFLGIPANGFSQGGRDSSREAPERPSRVAPVAPDVVAVAAVAAAPPFLKYASLDLGGDSSDTLGGNLYIKVGFPNATNGLRSRLNGVVVFDPITSAPDSSGVRQTSVGDLWLRGAFTVVREQSSRPKIYLQYGIKAPLASDDKNLGSGFVDHRFIAALDKTFARDVWSNFTFTTTWKGAAEGTPVQELARFVGQLEVPVPVGRLSGAYQAYVQFDTPYEDANLSSYQQHGVSIQVQRSPIWLGGGFSVGRDAGSWTPGGYLRLEVR